jgi:hypothetical protein
MEQTISTVLATNEVIHITGPGAVQLASSNTVAITTAKASAVAKVSAVAKASATAGLLTTSVAPLVGFAVLVGGLTLMVKMAGGYATSKK